MITLRIVFGSKLSAYTCRKVVLPQSAGTNTILLTIGLAYEAVAQEYFPWVKVWFRVHGVDITPQQTLEEVFSKASKALEKDGWNDNRKEKEI